MTCGCDRCAFDANVRRDYFGWTLDMSRNGICPRCGGKGSTWTGKERITCTRCNGTGSGLTK
jgi:DnaJ-class molecular chaperone